MTELRRAPERASGLRNRIRYRFDILLSHGMWVVLLWLGAITVLTVLLSAFLLTIFGVTLSGSEDASFLEDFWQSLLRVLDTGTMAADVGWGRRLLSLLVTVFGVLIAGTLIGLIATGVEQRVEEMQRGRSTVVETGHVVLLGGSPRLPVVIEQLALASRKGSHKAVVVLADEEASELQGRVRAALPDGYGGRLVVRRGDPTRVADLTIAGVRDARAVIVLADEHGSGDAAVVKAVLAVGAAVGGFDQIPIVAELSDLETAAVLLRACAGGQVHSVVALQSVARTTAFALREPGLNQVVQELLDFRGSDIHVGDLGVVAGSTFGAAVGRFTNVRPIGLMRPDGGVELNPAPQTILQRPNRLVVIADDGETWEAEQSDEAASTSWPDAEVQQTARHIEDEQLIIVGWNALGAQLLTELDRFSTEGSTAEIIYDSRLLAPDDIEIPPTAQLVVTVQPIGASTSPLAVAQSRDATAIVMLGYRKGVSPTEADSRTLLNLMLLRRDLAARSGRAPRIVVELLDADTVDLARMTGADDYVVSDGIASRLMTQFALQPERRSVLLDLYAEDSPSVRLIPASDLGVAGDIAFSEIVSRAYAAGQLAIGWRTAPGDLALNPRTSDRIRLGAEDQVVVIA